MKLFLIRIADWFDDNVLRHRFYAICKLIGNSSWWDDKPPVQDGQDKT